MDTRDRVDYLSIAIGALCCAAAALALYVLLICRSLAAQPLASMPVSGPVPGCIGYPSAEAAAVGALRRALAIDEFHEYAGAVFRVEGKYCFTRPVSNQEDAQFAVRIEIPKDAALVALYHSHPSGPHSSAFSPTDVHIAQAMHIVSYILSIDDMEVRRFDPSKDDVRTLDRDDLSRLFAPGVIVASLR